MKMFEHFTNYEIIHMNQKLNQTKFNKIPKYRNKEKKNCQIRYNCVDFICLISEGVCNDENFYIR